MTGSSDHNYKARLGDVLRTRDPDALHLFLRQSAAGYGDERQVGELEQRSHEEMTELMHRMILARPDLADLHAESQAWLAGRNLAPARSPGRGTGESASGRQAGRSGRHARPPKRS